MEYLDLVDEMAWEDNDKVEFITLEEAGLEDKTFDTIPACRVIDYFDNER